MKTTKNHKVPAVNFIGTMMANVDNEKMSDKDFRDFIRNALPIIEKPDFDALVIYDSIKLQIKKYYEKE